MERITLLCDLNDAELTSPGVEMRHVQFRAKAFGFCGYRVAIGDQQIDLPVWWRPRTAKRWRENSPNELIVVK